MTPELAAALTALVLALVNWLQLEVRERRRRERDHVAAAHLADVQRKVGADRRAADGEPPAA